MKAAGDTPPSSTAATDPTAEMPTVTPPPPPPSPEAAAPVCRKCNGDPRAAHHANGCPQSRGHKARARSKAEGRKPNNARAPRGKAAAGAGAGAGVYTVALTEYVVTVGSLVSMAGMARQSRQLVYDGNVLIAGAGAWAESMDALAAENPRLAAGLDFLVGSSTWAAAATASAGLVVPILACHRILPPTVATYFGADLPPEAPADADLPDVSSPNGRVRPTGPTAADRVAAAAAGAPRPHH